MSAISMYVRITLCDHIDTTDNIELCRECFCISSDWWVWLGASKCKWWVWSHDESCDQYPVSHVT